MFGPEYVQQVLSNPGLFLSLEPAKNAPAGSSPQRLWTGLGTTNGEVHKRGRRLMLPAFHKKRVEGYRDDMVTLFQRMLDGWRPGEVRDLSADMRRVTLLVVTKALFGLEDEQECLAHGELLSEWFRLFGSTSVQILQHDWPLLPYRRVMRISERGEAAIRDMIARKRREGGGNDVLSLLLEARNEDGGSLSDEEMVRHSSQRASSGLSSNCRPASSSPSEASAGSTSSLSCSTSTTTCPESWRDSSPSSSPSPSQASRRRRLS